MRDTSQPHDSLEVFGRAIESLLDDQSLAAEDRERRRAEYVARAIEGINTAARLGYLEQESHRQILASHADFEPFREEQAYTGLMESFDLQCEEISRRDAKAQR